MVFERCAVGCIKLGELDLQLPGQEVCNCFIMKLKYILWAALGLSPILFVRGDCNECKGKCGDKKEA